MRRLRTATWLVLVGACADGDGDGTPFGPDCDDARAEDHPGAEEVCDGRDNDCDGHVDEDVAIEAWLDRDGDGYGDPAWPRRVCTLPEDGALQAGDCDDADPLAFPGSVEVCDGRDDDCDGEVDEGTSETFYADEDGDGHGDRGRPLEGCVVGPGASRTADDCDDDEPLAWAGAEEVCDGVDNDCDDRVDEDLPRQAQWEDADGDGGGGDVPVLACPGAPGVVPRSDDCDDADAALGPHAAELPGDDVDQDCDGYVDEIVVADPTVDLDAAIAAAGPDDVVQVGEGLWTGPFDLSGFRGTLAGEGCDRSVLFGDVIDATVTMDGGRIEGLTLTGGARGGLLVLGAVEARGLCVVDNTNLGLPGNPITGFGGGIEVREGSLDLQDSLIARNQAVDGGGVNVARDATLVAKRVAILDNLTTFDGAGLAARSGRAEVYASVIAGNRADDDGGAVTSREDASGLPGHVLLDRCTLVDNAALYDLLHPGVNGGYGSAVHVRPGSSAELRHTLVAFHAELPLAPLYAESRGTITTDEVGYAGNVVWDLTGGWDVRGLRGTPRFLRYERDGDPTTWDLRQHPTSDFRELGAWTGPHAADDDLSEGGRDADEDGLPDAWEEVVGLPTGEPDDDVDHDLDGLSGAEEWALGADPLRADTDGDGVPDGEEVDLGRDPLRPGPIGPVVVVEGQGLAVVGERVHLSSASYDASGDWPSHTWSLVASPAGGGVVLVPEAGGGVSFVPSAPGLYTLQLDLDAQARQRAGQVTVRAVDATVVPDDVATLEAAVAAAADGAVIAVRPGRWPVDLRSEDRALTLVGLGAPEEVELVPAGGGRVVTWTSPERLHLERLTITEGDAASGGGVLCTACLASDLDPACQGSPAPRASLDLVDVRLVGNFATAQGGGLRAERCDVVGRRLRVDTNTAGTDGGGVWAVRSSLDLVDVEFVDNHAGSRGGGLYGSSEEDVVRVRQGVFAGNSATDGAAMAWLALVDPRWAAEFAQLSVTDHTTLGAVVRDLRGSMMLRGVVFDGNLGVTLAQGPPSGTPGQLDLLAVGVGDNLGGEWGSQVIAPRDVVHLDHDPLSSVTAGLRRAACWRPGSEALDAGWADHADADGSRAALGACGGPDAPPDVGLAQVDTDGDGMPDLWERLFGLDRLVANDLEDADEDGRTDLDEYLLDGDPTDPLR